MDWKFNLLVKFNLKLLTGRALPGPAAIGSAGSAIGTGSLSLPTTVVCQWQWPGRTASCTAAVPLQWQLKLEKNFKLPSQVARASATASAKLPVAVVKLPVCCHWPGHGQWPLPSRHGDIVSESESAVMVVARV